MTSVQNLGSHKCGGVLIAEDLVLTAAHCVDGTTSASDPSPKLFVGGLRSDGDPQAETHTACRTIIHDKYDPSDVSKGYDIALMVLSEKSAKIPIKMGTVSPGQTVRVMGWGIDGDNGPQSVLQEADLQTLENEACFAKLRDGARCPTESGEGSCAIRDVLDSMVCAEMAGTDTCQGDSGGPLIIAGEGCGENDVLVGVTSFGFKCNDPQTALKFPSSYTRVSSFASWIEARGAGESSIVNNSPCDGGSPDPVSQSPEAGTSKTTSEEDSKPDPPPKGSGNSFIISQNR
ncbi:hypothetical protein BSKO_00570 [Bryopsis sp. KO-2023]|nr:hypothetical protein BSKO_00570 [Bryopsis sp. KO-2023]